MRTLYVGAGLALAGGLLLGVALRPQLDAAPPSEDPQAYAGWPGAQTPSPFDDAVTYARYASQTPDYVVGTDTLKLLAAADVPPPEEKSYDDAAPIRDLLPEPQRTVARDPAAPAEGAAGAEQAANPSAAPAAAPAAGDAARDAAAEAPSEPGPPALPVQDDEPTPEATGDTRIGQ